MITAAEAAAEAVATMTMIEAAIAAMMVGAGTETRKVTPKPLVEGGTAATMTVDAAPAIVITTIIEAAVAVAQAGNGTIRVGL
jgi:multisubunit Na+/H+ antiporter MnhC subunit